MRFFTILILSTTLCYSQLVDVSKIYPLASVESPPVFDNCLNIIQKDQKKCFEQTVNDHIQRNLNYPEDAFDSKSGGRVLVSFIIDRNGYISDIFTKGPNQSLENEVERVVSLLSNPKPAKINGIDVSINYSLPVNFYLISQFKYSEINVPAGTNVYQSPDIKSKQIFYTKGDLKLNARNEGRFWLVDLNEEGSLLGYVSKDDVISIEEYNKTNLEVVKPKSVYVNEQLDKIENNLTIDEVQLNENDKNNQFNSEKNNLLKQYELDNLKLDSYIQKLEKQKEIDRKIPGTNDSDLYYGNALKELIKILKKEIEIKYLILSDQNPDIFYDTDFDIRSRNNKKKAEKYLNEVEFIQYDYVKDNFLNYPSVDDRERIFELLSEIDNLKYVTVQDSPSIEELKSIDVKETVVDFTSKSQLNNSNEEDEIKQIAEVNSSSGENVSDAVNNSQDSSIDVSTAKKRLKDLFFLFSQDLISKEIYEEFALELRQIIDTEEKKNITSTSDLKISPKEALERIRSLRSFLDQDLISKDTYDDAVKLLKDIATNID